MQNNKLTFRTDINGLRAWACLAVVFFHFQIFHFQGGFAGVDVFFVISGYLMAAILYPKLLEQNLNIIQFYTQRLKRVFPALFVMLLILLGAGSLILHSRDFYHLVRETKAALSFHYNVRFNDVDYFSEATTDWLLHTWTLGLEFQFYLLFPILLLVLYKLTKNIKHHLITLMLIAICSFVAMQYQVHYKPSEAFFMLQYRIWEFLAGAILFLAQYQKPTVAKKYSQAIVAIGWVLLLSFFLLATDAGRYPDYRTLIPVLATVAILYPIRDGILTNNPIAQYLGSASYSIYLWHWCVYVLIGLYGYHDNLTALYLFAGLSVVIGCISYILVEKGANRFFYQISSYKKQLALLVATIVISSLATNQLRKEGSVFWVEKNSEKVADITAFKDDKSKMAIECNDNEREDCLFGDTTSPVGLIVVGDSHSASLMPILNQMAKENKMAIASFMAGGCPVVFDIQVRKGDKDEQRGQTCLQNLSQFKQGLVQYPNAKVLIVNRNNTYLLGHNENNKGFLTQYYYQQPIDTKDQRSIQQWQHDFANDLLKTTCQIAKTHQTYWVKPTPELGIDVPKTLASNIFYRNDHSDIKISLNQHNQRQILIEPVQKQAEQQCGVVLIDVNPAYCDMQHCYGSSARQVYYYDDNHLNITGSLLARPYLQRVFD